MFPPLTHTGDLSASAGKRKHPFPKASNLSSTSHSCCFTFTPLALCAPFPIMQQACTMSCIFLHNIFLREPSCILFFQMCQSLFPRCHQAQRTLFCSHTHTDTHTTARAHKQHSYMVSSSQGKRGYTFAHSQIFPTKNTARYLPARTDCCSLQVCETGGDTEVVSTPCLSIGFIVLAQTH